MSSSAFTVPVGEVADINPTFKSATISPDELVDFLPMAAVDEGNSVALATEYRPLSDVQKGYTNFNDGDVLLAKITPCFENGKIAQVRLKHRCGFGSTEFHVLRPHANKLDGRYLVHFLRRDEIRIDGARKMTGSAGQRRVPKHYLESLPIYLPALSEQRRIAAILDQADALRAKRREALAQLDSLTQSIFIEMFGDPESNPKGLPVVNLEDLCTRVTDGTHQSPKWETSGIPFLFISNIVNGEITYATDKFISRETYNELTKRCPIQAGDVLFTTVGSYGNTAVVSGDREFCFQRHIAHIKPDAMRLDPQFCAAMLQSPGVRRQVDKSARGVAQKTVNLSDLKTLRVFAPQLEQQQAFTARLDVLKSIKGVQRQSLDELEALFATIQHSAFQGEL